MSIKLNSIFNLSGQLACMLCALIASPLIISRLGTEAYGTIVLTLTLIGSTSILDMGLTRGVTHFVGRALAEKNGIRAKQIILRLALIQAVAGLFLSGILYCFSNQLCNLYSVSSTKDIETICKQTAVVMPFVLLGSILRAALEGIGNFGQVNAIKTLINCATYAAPIIGASINLNITQITLVICVVRVIGTVVFAATLLQATDWNAHTDEPSEKIPSLLSYCGWSAISSLVVPVLSLSDRFLLGVISDIHAVGLYGITGDVALGISAIPSAISVASFTYFSRSQQYKNSSGNEVATRTTIIITCITSSVASACICFCNDALMFWQGKEIALAMTPSMQLIVAGTAINCGSWVLSAKMLGDGGARHLALIQTGELCFYIPLLYFLTSAYGIYGTALSAAARLIVECWMLILSTKQRDDQRKQIRECTIAAHGMIAWGFFAGGLGMDSVMMKIVLLPPIVIAFNLAFLKPQIITWVARNND